jgi:hypothetical protein
MLITQNQIPRDECVAFSDEDLIVDLHVYYWLGKSSKRENELNAFYVFCDTTYINRFWNMNPHVGLALKRQFPYVGNVLSALEKLFLLGLKKQSVFFRLLTKQFLMTEVCLLGKAYILHYYINHFSGDEFLRITILSSRPPTLTLRDQNPWQLCSYQVIFLLAIVLSFFDYGFRLPLWYLPTLLIR